MVKLYFMLQVVINFALVKGLFYNRQEPTFHQWTDQSQLYGLNFVSKNEAQVFGNNVFTSLENLKTTGKAFKCCSNFLFIPHAVTSVSVKTCLNHKAENVLIKKLQIHHMFDTGQPRTTTVRCARTY